jgi:hypothetical protein
MRDQLEKPGGPPGNRQAKEDAPMGLAFSVGNPWDVFLPDYAERVRARLAREFGPGVVSDSPEEAYSSDEVGWGGWARLQEAAAAAVGADRMPHLLSMEAWNGCYVPVPTEPTAFPIPGNSAPLAVGSLAALVGELEAVGAALGLPTDDDGLRELATEHADDEPREYDMDYQTYAELLLAARVAQRRRQPLWVVK